MKKGIEVNQFVLKLTSFCPIAWLMGLYLFTFLCSIQLGHFPRPSIDDPKLLGFDFFYSSVFIGFTFTLYGIFLWILSFLISRFYYKMVLRKYSIIFTLGLGLMFIQLLLDPFEIIFWYMD